MRTEGQIRFLHYVLILCTSVRIQMTFNRAIVANHEGRGLFSWVEPLILVFPSEPRTVECDTRSITIYFYFTTELPTLIVRKFSLGIPFS